jgi:predicted deacylase
MGNYSLTAIFTKEPVVIAGGIRSVLYVLVLLGLVVLEEKQLAAIALGLEVVLGLFVRQGSTSTVSPNLTVGTSVNAGAAVVASVDPPPEPTAAAPVGGTPA